MTIHSKNVSKSICSIGMLLLAGCGGHTQPVAKPHPPRPPANATSETVVQASGAQQTDISGLIEHDVVIGEPLAAGTISITAGISVRHGFAPPLLPDWPRGIASHPLIR